MIINSLRLKNIRSYLDEEIKFPDGSVMLSGDIGSGKTSILLSIEFALFGIIRGTVSGIGLLRHGAKEGFVELDFTVNNQNLIIHRTLKRGSKSVGQEAGYLIIEGKKHDLSAIELKSKILEYLGYPDELLTKSKSFIFRYTVYTPQEEMKHILYEKPEDRLDVLRRIFDIDKYKRIKENSLLYLKELRRKETELTAKTEDLTTKKSEIETYEKRIELAKQDIHKLELEIIPKKQVVKDKEEALEAINNEVKEILVQKEKIRNEKLQIENKKRQIVSKQEELKVLNSQLQEIKIEDIKFDPAEFEALNEKKQGLQDNISKIQDRESQFKAMINASENIIGKISELNECPTCMQEVNDSYKDKVHKKEHEKISSIKNQMEKLSELKSQRQSDVDELNKKIEAFLEVKNQIRVNEVKKQRIVDFQNKIANLNNEILSLQKEVTEYVEKPLPDTELQEKQKQLAIQALNEAREVLQKDEITIAEKKKELSTIEEFMKKINQEISAKETLLVELKKVKTHQAWISKFFMNVVALMEKQIMLHVHNEFNQYFQEWFNVLIEDENLNVRLDEAFTPIIEQNGYETYIENLSGGEKTSVALAYRLSLNKVINDFIGNINTKDLLILDEPTDGFSSEQLDKIRELLDRIKIRQIILVSHEPKLESYVDHIIRVHKEEHVSRIISM